MLRSMTGYGAASGPVEGVEFAVEIRSVNNRYFKAIVKLPESWSPVETDVEKLLRDRLRRGTVAVTVRMRLPDEQAACRVNTKALAAYLEQLRPVQVEADPMLRVDLGSLLQLPGICEPPALEELCQRTREGLMGLIDKALDALVAMRVHEGEALQADLLANCDAIETNVAGVAEAAPRVVLDYQQRLARRVEELTRAGNVQIDQDQLAREVAIFAERCDIAEELTRLKGHVGQFRQTVSAERASGRKLEFIAQEMLREANTIASKAPDSEVARAVVDIKTAIDRIKEQVQNVE